jgi:ParB family chromosome partitioning protein
MSAPRKAALGKGLSALLPQLPPEGIDEFGEGDPRSRLYSFEDHIRLAGRITELDVDAIRPNPYQPRHDFDEDALDELAASIRQLGIIQPLTVRSLGGGLYELISGERRLRASRRAGVRRVPAYVREADTEAMLEMALVENVQRADLNPIEEALGYQRLIDEVGLKQEEVAERVGRSRPSIANALRLLRLPPRIQASLRDGSITAGHARMLVTIDDEEAQLRLHHSIVERGLSVRDVERMTRELRRRREPRGDGAPGPAPTAPTVPTRERLEIDAFAARLREHLSTRVELRPRSDGAGSITIEYYSPEDLERLMERLLP